MTDFTTAEDIHFVLRYKLRDATNLRDYLDLRLDLFSTSC